MAENQWSSRSSLGKTATPRTAQASSRDQEDGQQHVAHVAVEIGDVEVVLAEEFAVDVREGGERFVEVLLALVFGGVEDAEKVSQLHAEVGAVFGSAVRSDSVRSGSVVQTAI